MMTCTTSRGRIKFRIRDAKRKICIGKGMCLVMSRGVKGADGIGTLEDLTIMLNTLPEYQTNQAAIDDGLIVGDLYWAANGNTEIAEGAFMRVV